MKFSKFHVFRALFLKISENFMKIFSEKNARNFQAQCYTKDGHFLQIWILSEKNEMEKWIVFWLLGARHMQKPTPPNLTFK